MMFLGLGARNGDSGCRDDLDLKLARDLIDRFLSGVVGFSVSIHPNYWLQVQAYNRSDET